SSGASYAEALQESLEEVVRACQVAGEEQRKERGGVFLLRADRVPPQDQILLRAAARLVVLAQRGTLSEQVVRLEGAKPEPAPPGLLSRQEHEAVTPPALDLQFWNGLGGFTGGGGGYVTVLGQGQWTPAPWINVVANPEFGFQVSESGSGYTWCANSRENKLTPWSNDPVGDTPGEAFYIRDEDSGLVWGPTLLPSRKG